MLGEEGGVRQEATRLFNAPGDPCSQSGVNCSTVSADFFFYSLTSITQKVPVSVENKKILNPILENKEHDKKIMNSRLKDSCIY